MSELLLDSLEIKGYRCFEHLTIEKLGRVNLIVGKNNVGKTALLEALWIYAQRGRAETLVNMLAVRDELPNPSRLQQTGEDSKLFNENVWKIRNLFHNYPKLEKPIETGFSIGMLNKRIGKLLVQTSWYILSTVQEEYESNTHIRLISTYQEEYIYDDGEYEHRQQEEVVTESIPLQSLLKQRLNLPDFPSLHCLFVRALGLEKANQPNLWDKIALTSLEDEVANALHIIQPDVKRVNFIGNPPGDDIRIPVVQMRGSQIPVPVRSLGEGMNRLLGIALALVNCKDGMLLIDEIESGLHYTVLPDVWRLIFKTARELNVQVFATTHSYDCIRAFQRAADEDEGEGMLIRLVNKDGKICAITFDEDDLETVAEQQIEVR